MVPLNLCWLAFEDGVPASEWCRVVVPDEVNKLFRTHHGEAGLAELTAELQTCLRDGRPLSTEGPRVQYPFLARRPRRTIPSPRRFGRAS